MGLWRDLQPIRNRPKYFLQSLAARLAVTGLDRRPRSVGDLDGLSPRSIVVSRTDRIGDLLVSTPLIDALHQRWPDARLVMIPGPMNRAALEGLPFVEEGPAFGREPRSFFRVRAWLKRQRFDLAVSLRSESLAGVCVSAWSRAPVRMVLQAKPSQAAHNLVLGVYEVHHLTRFRHAAALLGVRREPLRPTYIVPVSAQQRGDEVAAGLVAAGGPLVGIQVPNRGSRRHAVRALSGRVLVELCRSLAADGATVVLCGHGSEREEAVRLQQEVPAARVCPPLALAPFAGLLRRFALFISNYTGTLHLADAVGCATVGYCSRGHYEPWHLIGEQHRTLVSDDVAALTCGELLEAARALRSASRAAARSSR